MWQKVFLLGRLGNAPELKQGQKGGEFCRISVATNTVWTDQKGEKQERTDWHNVVVWGKQARSVASYLEKGSPVFVEGRIQTRVVDDGDGNKRYYTDINAERVQFLPGVGGSKAQGSSEPPRGYKKATAVEDEDAPPF